LNKNLDGWSEFLEIIQKLDKIRYVGAVAELADAMDLKSIGRKALRVQVPPAPQVQELFRVLAGGYNSQPLP
jgi:hypothetical protein